VLRASHINDRDSAAKARTTPSLLRDFLTRLRRLQPRPSRGQGDSVRPSAPGRVRGRLQCHESGRTAVRVRRRRTVVQAGAEPVRSPQRASGRAGQLLSPRFFVRSRHVLVKNDRPTTITGDHSSPASPRTSSACRAAPDAGNRRRRAASSRPEKSRPLSDRPTDCRSLPGS